VDAVAEWRARATNALTGFHAAFDLVPVLVGIASSRLTPEQRGTLPLLYGLVVAAAMLRRWPPWARLALLLLCQYIMLGMDLYRQGIWGPVRVTLVSGPAAMLILVGIKPGLILGAVNFIALLTCYYATELGWLPSRPPVPFAGGEWLLESAYLATGLVPQLLLLAWFSHHLVCSIRRECDASLRLAREAAARERLEREVLETAERERQSIGRDLHDGVCQDITGLVLRCKTVQKSLERRQAPEAIMLGDTIRDLGEVMREVHGVSRRLTPGRLDGPDLASALDELVRSVRVRTELDLTFRSVGSPTALAPQAALQLYRIAQEALHNAIRHAGANRIEVTLHHDPKLTLLSVEDDGRGLPPSTDRGHGLGLRTMLWRASTMGGALALGPRAGGGTRVVCRVETCLAPSNSGASA
jgi:signal transduction histidine kinase